MELAFRRELPPARSHSEHEVPCYSMLTMIRATVISSRINTVSQLLNQKCIYDSVERLSPQESDVSPPLMTMLDRQRAMHLTSLVDLLVKTCRHAAMYSS
jgi:hypothetical protein